MAAAGAVGRGVHAGAGRGHGERDALTRALCRLGVVAVVLGGCVDREVTVRLKAGVDLTATERWRGAAPAKGAANVDKAKASNWAGAGQR